MSILQRLQQWAANTNIDWNKVWAVLQKLTPFLQEVMMTMLENGGAIPFMALADGPPPAADDAKIQEAAKIHSVGPEDLRSFLQTLAPALGKLILAMLTKKELKG